MNTKVRKHYFENFNIYGDVVGWEIGRCDLRLKVQIEGYPDDEATLAFVDKCRQMLKEED